MQRCRMLLAACLIAVSMMSSYATAQPTTPLMEEVVVTAPMYSPFQGPDIQLISSFMNNVPSYYHPTHLLYPNCSQAISQSSTYNCDEVDSTADPLLMFDHVFEDSMLRDSNAPGYWIVVVNRPGFPRHLAAILMAPGGGHERQALHG